MRRNRTKTSRFKKIFILFVGIFIFMSFGILVYLSIPNILYLLTGGGREKLIIPQISYSTQKDFENALGDHAVEVKSMILASDSATLVVRIDSGTYVYFDFTRSAIKQVNSLSEILSRLSIEGHPRKPSVIDLRYTNPVIKF